MGVFSVFGLFIANSQPLQSDRDATSSWLIEKLKMILFLHQAWTKLIHYARFFKWAIPPSIPLFLNVYNKYLVISGR